MKILIADDLQTFRLVLYLALKELGHEVVATVDGEEAWQAYQAGEFPVVITDWQMPRADGLELCRRVRSLARPRYTYILMLTALESKPEYMQAMDAGADDFLIKPFEKEMLAARLRVAERIGGLLSEAQQLHAILPYCPRCKKFRDEQGHWTKLEEYVAARLHTKVEPARCPYCQTQHRKDDQKLQADMQQLRDAARHGL